MSRRAPRARGPAALVAALVLSASSALAPALCAGCRAGGGAFTIVPDAPPGPYDALAVEERARLLSAIADFEAGQLAQARAALARLVEERADNIVVGRWSQDVDLAVARAGDPAGGEGFADELRRAWRARAETQPGAAALVLAARLEHDPPAALLLLERALELDPACAWAHYARAHVHARAGEWEPARESIRAALAADPGHLPTLRLHAWMLAQAGRWAEGIGALEAWLEHARDDLRAGRREREEARLDVALMLLADGSAREARERVLAVDASAVDEVRRLTALAACEQALDEGGRALDAASAAAAADPSALLPAIQEALLLEHWIGDRDRARAAWRRVLALAGGGEDLGAVLQRMRAQVHLARSARRERGPNP